MSKNGVWVLGWILIVFSVGCAPTSTTPTPNFIANSNNRSSDDGGVTTYEMEPAPLQYGSDIGRHSLDNDSGGSTYDIDPAQGSSPIYPSSGCTQTIRVSRDSNYINIYTRIPDDNADARRYQIAVFGVDDGAIRPDRLMWGPDHEYVWALVSVRQFYGWVHADHPWTTGRPSCRVEPYSQ